MNLTNLTTALLLLTSACGVVVDPGDDSAPIPGGPSFEEPAVGQLDDEPVPPTLFIDPPQAATTAGSLFSMSFDNDAAIANVVDSTEHTRIDVVSQTIRTATATEVQLVVELAPPTGHYSRTLVSDTIEGTQTFADHVLCEQNGISQYDPRCEATTPPPREMASSGSITESQWKLTVVDAVTGTPVRSCTNSGPSKVSCLLPPRAGVTYQILASAHGFANLWEGTAALGAFAMDGVPYVGARAPSDWLCWDWRVTTNALYCAARYELARFVAIDRARLDFDPITVRITANGTTTTMASPALSWDPGNDDVPGSTY